MITQNNKSSHLESAQVGWACRRGMLELDVLLGGFFQDRYETLTAEEKTQFVLLLNCSDPEIYQWLLKSSEPPLEFQNIVSMIITHARSHF